MLALSLLAGLGVIVGYSCVAVVAYLFFVPTGRWYQRAHPAPRAAARIVGAFAFVLASLGSLLRAPLGLAPYLLKVALALGLRVQYEAIKTTYTREAINLLGDIVNLGGTALLIRLALGAPHWSLLWLLCGLMLAAEYARLLSERVPTVFSAIWQLIPHRVIALRLKAWERMGAIRGMSASWLRAYTAYYLLDERARGMELIAALKERAAYDPAVAARVAYLRGVRVVPYAQGLRGGLVRDVARGEIFIHPSWSADPWMLIGLLMRRSPWVFDPRFLRRPFYYMSEANPLTSLFVLRHADYSPFFALFQFGHEIRVARLRWFYLALRLLGWDVERKVAFDGAFLNDQVIHRVGRALGYRRLPTEPRLLCSDEEVAAELAAANVEGRDERPLTALALAERYTYPLCYVEDVLLPRLQRDHVCDDALPIDSTREQGVLS